MTDSASKSLEIRYYTDLDVANDLAKRMLDEKLVLDAKVSEANSTEADQLNFDLATIACVVTLVGFGIQITQLAIAVTKSLQQSRAKVIVVSGPHGRTTITVEGKRDEVLLAEISKALPKLKDVK